MEPGTHVGAIAGPESVSLNELPLKFWVWECLTEQVVAWIRSEGDQF